MPTITFRPFFSGNLRNLRDTQESTQCLVTAIVTPLVTAVVLAVVTAIVTAIVLAVVTAVVISLVTKILRDHSKFLPEAFRNLPEPL